MSLCDVRLERMLFTMQTWEPATGRLLQGAVAASICEAFCNIRYFSCAARWRQLKEPLFRFRIADVSDRARDAAGQRLVAEL